MKRRVSPAWIIALVSAGVLGGTLLSLVTKDSFLGLPWLIIGLSLFGFCLVNRMIWLVALAVVAGGLIGLWRGSQNYPSQIVFNHYFNQSVELTGVVSEDVALGKNGQQQIKLKQVKLNGQPLDGQVWVSSYDQTEIKRSDLLEVRGQLNPGFGSFAASLNRAEIISVTKIRHADPARELRDWFSTAARKVIAEPQASLGLGFLTGQNSTLPESLSNNLKVLGLTHIVVASGYNLTILVRFARGLFARISKYLATLVSGLLISGFILVTGASPSMTRAGLITGLSLAAWYYGRRIHPLVLLPFAAAVTVLFNPAYIWGDLGWYLSFAAFAGIIILAPLLISYLWGDKPPNGGFRILVEAFSAQLLTAPLTAFIFGHYATLSLPANLLILPLIPLAMLATFAAGIASILLSPIAGLFGFIAEIILSYMTLTVNKLSNLPLAQIDISLSVTLLAIIYLLVVILAIWLWRRTGHDFSRDSIIE